MKILHVTPYYEPDFHHGGVVRSISILCRELVKLGHEVTVFTSQDSRSQVKRPLGVPCDVGGVRVVYFKNRLGGFGFGWDMLRAAKNVREFDVVHVAAFWQLFGLPVFLRALQASVPNVMSPRGSLVMVRDSSLGTLKYRLFFNLVNRHLMNRADAIHFTAELERLDARSLGLAVPSFCIPNAVAVEEFRSLPERSEARRGLGIDERIPVVAFVGRLDRRKALDILVRAFARVSGRASEAVLVLAGPDFGEMAMLKTLSRSLNIEGRVIFLGLVDAQKRAEVLASADLVTLTSLAENFGNAGAEAISAGVPVLISDQCGVADGVEEAGVGRVIPVDEDIMAVVLNEMLGDESSLKQMASRGPAFAESRYAAGEVAGKLVQAYQDLVSGNRAVSCRWSDG